MPKIFKADCSASLVIQTWFWSEIRVNPHPKDDMGQRGAHLRAVMLLKAEVAREKGIGEWATMDAFAGKTHFSGWKTDWITIGDLETTIWKLRFGNYGWGTNNLCFSNCVSPIWKLWFRNYKSPIWKPNLRDLITKNLRFDNYVLGTEIPRFGNYHSPIW